MPNQKNHDLPFIQPTGDEDFYMDNPKELNLKEKEEIIKETLIRILGNDALSLGKMQVSKEVSVLVKAVDYLILQMKILSKIEAEEGKKYHMEKVFYNLINLLKKDV